MTIGERAAQFAQRATGDNVAELIQGALEEELKELADKLDRSAADVRKLYTDLSLRGEWEARPFEEVAREIRGRLTCHEIQKQTQGDLR